MGQGKGEIGLRMAFGASTRDVTVMVLRQAFLLTGCGLGIGMAISILFRQILANEVFGIRFLDLPVYFGVSLVLIGVALAAAILPAWRAACVDPVQTLRTE